MTELDKLIAKTSAAITKAESEGVSATVIAEARTRLAELKDRKYGTERR